MASQKRLTILGIVFLSCAALGGCGGEAAGTTASARERVQQFLPAASRIRCADRAAATRCDVLVGKAPGGLEAWSCEFIRTADSGSDSCWSEHGTASHLRLPGD